MTTQTISSRTAEAGAHGEIPLAAGERVAMRMWRDEPPTDGKPSTTSPHETVGYVISGRAKLVLANESIALEPGDSYCVPAGAVHSYHILETFTAIEATAPPAA